MRRLWVNVYHVQYVSRCVLIWQDRCSHEIIWPMPRFSTVEYLVLHCIYSILMIPLYFLVNKLHGVVYGLGKNVKDLSKPRNKDISLQHIPRHIQNAMCLKWGRLCRVKRDFPWKHGSVQRQAGGRDSPDFSAWGSVITPGDQSLKPGCSPHPNPLSLGDWLTVWLDRKGLSFIILTVASLWASHGNSTGVKGGRGWGGLLSSPAASLFSHLLNLSGFDTYEDATQWFFFLLFFSLCVKQSREHVFTYSTVFPFHSGRYSLCDSACSRVFASTESVRLSALARSAVMQLCEATAVLHRCIIYTGLSLLRSGNRGDFQVLLWDPPRGSSLYELYELSNTVNTDPCVFSFISVVNIFITMK